MSASFESALLSIWQQSLIDKKKNVDLDGEAYPVRIAVVVAGKIHTYRYFRVRPNQEVPVPESVVV
jgi:hypothetical protein